jgi:hypothetical protein
MSIRWVFHPDPTLHVMTGVNPNLMVPLDPVPVFIVTRDPDPLSFFGNPLPLNLPVA